MWHVDKNPERTEPSHLRRGRASFANARGGVLVMGVTDKREIVGIGSGHELKTN